MVLMIKRPLPTLNYFIECMAEGGTDVVFLDAASEQKFYKQIDILNDEIEFLCG